MPHSHIDSNNPSSTMTASPSSSQSHFHQRSRSRSVSHQEPSRPRSRPLLSRLAGSLGLSPKPAHLADFHILTTSLDPSKRYAPSDVVRGKIHVHATRPMRITHITVQLLGFVKVFKNYNFPGGGESREAGYPATMTTGGARSRQRRWLGRNAEGTNVGGNCGGRTGFTPLFVEERVVCGDGRLPAKRLDFRFEIPFPAGPLPSSLDVSAPKH